MNELTFLNLGLRDGSLSFEALTEFNNLPPGGLGKEISKGINPALNGTAGGIDTTGWGRRNCSCSATAAIVTHDDDMLDTKHGDGI